VRKESNESISSNSGSLIVISDSLNPSTQWKRVELFTIGKKELGFRHYNAPACLIIVKKCKRISIRGKGKLFLADQLAQIDQCITHAAQCCIDAYIGLVGDLLEAEASIMPEQHYFPLVFGQFIDQ